MFAILYNFSNKFVDEEGKQNRTAYIAALNKEDT